MSELDDAIARLEAALVRLEAATKRERGVAGDDLAAATAASVAARVDAALAKLSELLDREG